MQTQAWLYRDDQLAPGTEIFRSDRRFRIWTYSVSHSQLLLRAGTVAPRGGRQSRIDVLFKAVRAMKTSLNYDALIIRCATADERQRIVSQIRPLPPGHVFVLESTTDMDYVIAAAVGWREDDDDDNQPSHLAFFPPATNPDRILPTTPEPDPTAPIDPPPSAAIEAAGSSD